jgi:hypothetical protein
MAYVAPELGKRAFYCPHCNVYADQRWGAIAQHAMGQQTIEGGQASVCSHCKNISIWLNGAMLYPSVSNAPLSHPDTPVSVKEDYDEARKVFRDSPRSSAALLRLAIQKLCKELGEKGENLNTDIGELVKKGLPPRIQQSLDIVRVVGNNQVHPGTLDVRDDPTIATTLFELINVIVEDRISRPKQIEALYLKLPETSRKQIEQRDKASPQQQPNAVMPKTP